jgi:protein SCO1/2
MKHILWLAGALLALRLQAAPLAMPAPPSVPLQQRPGAMLPLDLSLIDSAGAPTTLRQAFGVARAVVLVPGYYTCAQLCGLVMQGVLESLAESGLPASSYRVVGFSIDPADTPATARARARAYRDYAAIVAARHGAASPVIEVQLFTASGEVSARLTRTLGYGVQQPTPDDARDGAGTLAHGAAVVVVTPDGRIARYFPGLRFDAQALREAIVQANEGRVGTASERLALLCGHYDPISGRYSLAVMTWLRLLGIGGASLLALWIWRRRHAPQRAAP